MKLRRALRGRLSPQRALSTEPIFELLLPIVDAHHHLWVLPEADLAALETQQSLFARAITPVFRRHSRYLFDEFMAKRLRCSALLRRESIDLRFEL